MSESVLLFVNEQPVRVSAASSMAEAVAAFDPSLAAKLQSGAAHLTDGRGIALEPSASVFPGAIVRVIVSARTKPTGSNAHS